MSCCGQKRGALRRAPHAMAVVTPSTPPPAPAAVPVAHVAQQSVAMLPDPAHGPG